MELREKIAKYLYDTYSPVRDKYTWSQYKFQEGFREEADRILAIIKQAEWKSKPDSEGWWWMPTPANALHDKECLWISHEALCNLRCDKGQWCKAIVPEIGEE